MAKTTARKTNFFPTVIRRGLLAWLCAAWVEYLLLPDALRSLETLAGLEQMSFFRLVLLWGVLMGIFSGIACLGAPWKWERIAMPLVFSGYAFCCLWESFSLGLLAGCWLILAVLLVYAWKGWQKEEPVPPTVRNSHPVWLALTVLFSFGFFLFVSAWGLGRYYSFSSPTFDFGIFSQMFHAMKTTGLPVTTLERDGPLSHFAVHVSPIYYFMLPLYWLFPSPATLPVLQAGILASAVIPFWKIGKLHGLSGPGRMALCTVLLLYPAYAGGTGYDIHENCFLTPMIAWLLYGLDRKSWSISLFSEVLTLMVKEDAAVYVAVIALWVIVKAVLYGIDSHKKELCMGLLLLAAALAWFLLVTRYLAVHGDGVMTFRYNNFLYGGSKQLGTVIQAVLLHPGYALAQCLAQEKLSFIALTFLPLLGLPVLTRRYEDFLLLIPYVLVNLMPDYTYQHNIFFQYTFGSAACLIYLSGVHLARMKRKVLLPLAAAVCAVTFSQVVVPQAARYPKQAIQYASYYDGIRAALDQIPEDASVATTTFYTAYLSQRESLYDIGYSSYEHVFSCEYIVLSSGAEKDISRFFGGKSNQTDGFYAFMEAEGYARICQVEGVLEIYRKGPSTSIG